MRSPQVSVVMGVYNGKRIVGPSVESILDQRGVELEFIIVDDGSTDGSSLLLDDYARRDARVRIIRQENQGLTRALIRGCAEAGGGFIARQDAGDVSLPGRLDKQLALLEADPATVLASTGTRFVGPQGEHLFDLIDTDKVATDGLLAGHLLRGPSCHGCTMFRRSAYEAVGGYRAQFRMAQDIDLWTRLAEKGSHRVVPEVLYQYEYALEGISAGRRREQRWFNDRILECAAARRQGKPETDVLRAVEEYSAQVRSRPRGKGEAAYFIGSLLAKTNASQARQYLLLAVRQNPMHWRAWIKLTRAFLSQSS